MRRHRLLAALGALGLIGAMAATPAMAVTGDNQEPEGDNVPTAEVAGDVSSVVATEELPTTVAAGDFRNVVGSFQGYIDGCNEWQPECVDSALDYDEGSGLFMGQFEGIPAGDYEFKVTGGSWDLNWGEWGDPGGDNIEFHTDGGKLFFFFDPTNNYAFATNASTLYTLPGNWQTAVGCGTWEPSCLASVLFPQPPDGRIYARSTTAIVPPPPVEGPNFQFKVAAGLSWDKNWGVDGVQGGSNVQFTTNAGELVTFTFDSVTKVPSVSTENPPLPGTGQMQAYWIAPDTIAWPTSLAAPAGNEFALAGVTTLALEPAGDLTEQQKKDFPRVASGFSALRVSPTEGGDLDAAVAEVLKGSIQVAARNTEDVLVAQTGAQIAGVLDNLYAGARDADLGLTWNGKTPTLTVWAPTAQNVSLKLWTDPSGDPQVLPANRDENGVWTVVGEPSWAGAQFLWSVEVFVASEDAVVTNDVTDPYSVGLTVDSLRSVIADLSDPATFPASWGDNPAPLRTQAEQTIYELHIRDFSIEDETVRPEYRGSYMAFTESDSDGMKHLERLADAGMTTVHLLPSFDIATRTIPELRSDQKVPEIPADAGPASELQQAAVAAVQNQDGFNWGYDPFHWSTPEGSYATTGNQDGAARTKEYREMVSALHGIGLRVVLDQVFNHTAASGQSDQSVLDRVVPGYYHRLNPLGQVENSTCCENIATENTMAEKMMVDSIVIWATEYGIDGFRFDLMGHHSLENMLQVRKALDELTVSEDGVDGESIYLYGEGWDFGEVAGGALFEQATQGNIGGTGIGAFNDRLRDAVRGGGPFDEDQRTYQGFGSGLYTDPNETATAELSPEEQLADLMHSTDLVRVGLAGNVVDVKIPVGDGTYVDSQDIDYNGQPAAYAEEPQESVNYVDAHDNETLYDNLIWKMPTDSTMDSRMRMSVLSTATVALAQSPSFWHAGSDLLRSKSLDRDSYNSGDHFNAVDWTMETNVFGTGLPMYEKNGDKWPLMRPLLEDAANKPTKAAMEQASEMSLDLLELRSSTPLFTLGTGDLIRERVIFPNGGSDTTPGLLVMRITDPATGSLNIDPNLDEVLVVFNASTEPIEEAIDDMAGYDLELSEVQREGSDEVVKATAWDAKTGTVTIPARTAAVLVAAAETVPGVDVPEAPSGLKVSNIQKNSVDLTWNAVDGATGYVVSYREAGSETVKTLKVTDPKATVAGLSAQTKYEFWVTAVNDAGESEPSAVVNATTLADNNGGGNGNGDGDGNGNGDGNGKPGGNGNGGTTGKPGGSGQLPKTGAAIFGVLALAAAALGGGTYLVKRRNSGA